MAVSVSADYIGNPRGRGEMVSPRFWNLFFKKDLSNVQEHYGDGCSNVSESGELFACRSIRRANCFDDSHRQYMADPSPAGSPEDVKCCENEGSSSGGSSGGSSSSKGDQKKESLIDEIKSNLVEEMAKQGFLYAAKKAKSLVIRPVTLAGAVISAFTPTTMGDAELKPEKSAELDPKKPEVNVGFPRVKDPKDLKRPDNSGSSYIGKPNSVRSIGVKK
jgi:hypothetical protein